MFKQLLHILSLSPPGTTLQAIYATGDIYNVTYSHPASSYTVEHVCPTDGTIMVHFTPKHPWKLMPPLESITHLQHLSFTHMGLK